MLGAGHAYAQSSATNLNYNEIGLGLSTVQTRGTDHQTFHGTGLSGRYLLNDTWFVTGTLDRVKQLGHEGMVEQYELAEEMLAVKTWFFEERFSCADAYFYWTFRRGAAFGADLSRFKNCMAHRQRMEQRASVQALLAHEEQVKAEFARAA